MIINYSFVLTQSRLGEEEINNRAATLLKEFQDFFKTDDGVIKYATSITKTLPSSFVDPTFKIEEDSYLTRIGYSYTNVTNFLVCIGIEVPFKFKYTNEKELQNLNSYIQNIQFSEKIPENFVALRFSNEEPTKIVINNQLSQNCSLFMKYINIYYIRNRSFIYLNKKLWYATYIENDFYELERIDMKEDYLFEPMFFKTINIKNFLPDYCFKDASLSNTAFSNNCLNNTIGNKKVSIAEFIMNDNCFPMPFAYTAIEKAHILIYVFYLKYKNESNIKELICALTKRIKNHILVKYFDHILLKESYKDIICSEDTPSIPIFLETNILKAFECIFSNDINETIDNIVSMITNNDIVIYKNNGGFKDVEVIDRMYIYDLYYLVLNTEGNCDLKDFYFTKKCVQTHYHWRSNQDKSHFNAFEAYIIDKY